MEDDSSCSASTGAVSDDVPLSDNGRHTCESTLDCGSSCSARTSLSDVEMCLTERKRLSEMGVGSVSKVELDPSTFPPCFRFQCDVCGSFCQSSWKLRTHRRTHFNDRPFQCSLCSSKFSRKFSLQNHLKTHTDVKEFQCPVEGCGKSFRLRGDLKRHSDTHLDFGKFPCPICRVQLKSASSRTIHIRAHAGDKQYECKECKKTFLTSSKLQCHYRVHSGERPYPCPHSGCDRGFSEISSLRKHVLAHEPKQIKRYPCHLCKKAYRQSSALAFHKRREHDTERAEKNCDVPDSNEGNELYTMASSPSAFVEVVPLVSYDGAVEEPSQLHPEEERNLLNLQVIDETHLATQVLLSRN